jgi:hypothetical protein
MFVDRIMQSLALDVLDHPTVLFLDNKSAIFAVTKAQDNERQRHIDLRAHCVRDSVTRKDMKLRFIPGAENPADAQTKPLGDTKFHKFRNFYQLVATHSTAQHYNFRHACCFMFFRICIFGGGGGKVTGTIPTPSRLSSTKAEP